MSNNGLRSKTTYLITLRWKSMHSTWWGWSRWCSSIKNMINTQGINIRPIQFKNSWKNFSRRKHSQWRSKSRRNTQKNWGTWLIPIFLIHMVPKLTCWLFKVMWYLPQFISYARKKDWFRWWMISNRCMVRINFKKSPTKKWSIEWKTIKTGWSLTFLKEINWPVSSTWSNRLQLTLCRKPWDGNLNWPLVSCDRKHVNCMYYVTMMILYKTARFQNITNCFLTFPITSLAMTLRALKRTVLQRGLLI